MKGKSRGKSEGNSSSEGNNKRRKIEKDEREKEITDTSQILKNIEEQIEYKHLRLKRHKSINEYFKCDQIMGEIIKLRNEKKILEKQLKRVEKKDAKSKWYHNRKDKEKKENKTTGESKRKGATKSLDIAQMLRKESDVSTSTSAGVSDSNESLPDTIILSPDERDDDMTIISPSKFPLDDANQPPAFVDHADSDEAGSESPDLFSQQNKAAFWEEARSRSPDLFGQQMNEDALNLVGEHIQVESKECDDNGDKEDRVAMDDKDFS